MVKQKQGGDFLLEFKKYHLSRVITVQEIESADYIQGIYISERFNTHQDAWELCVCLNGEAEVATDHQQFTLSKGQLYLILPKKPHKVSALTENSSVFIVSFTCTNGGNLLPLTGAPLQTEEQQVYYFHQMKQFHLIKYHLKILKML